MENALYGNACPPQESRRFSLYRRAADFASMNLPNCVFPQLLRTARRSAADMCIFSRIFIDFPFFLFFQKRACIFRTGVLYYFPKRIIRLREYLHCCFSPDKTDRSRPEPPSDLPRSDFYKSQPGRRDRLPDWLILPCSYFALYFPRPAPESPISVPFQMRTKFSRCLMRMASVATQRMARGIQPLRMAV